MSTKKNVVKPRGWTAALLRTAGFRGNLVDPEPGERFDIPGARRDWLKAKESVKGTDLHDYERAAACMASGTCKRVLEAETVMFIEGKLYVQYHGEDVIQRWIPESNTKALREFFDKDGAAPKRFMIGFRAAEGSERLEYIRKLRKGYDRKLSPSKSKDRYTGKSPRITKRILNPEIRNGILIAERIAAKKRAA